MNQLKTSTVSFLAVPAFVGLLASCAPAQTANANWKTAPVSLQTQWAEEVSPASALPAYPRPQMTAPTGNRLTAPVEPSLHSPPAAHSAHAALAASTPILDKQKELSRFTFWDNRDWDWYKARIPFFESPDAEIDETYYYRWELTTKHLSYGSPQSGYNITEFINRVPWAGRYGSISCSMPQQIYELRWLKDRRITDDYARYWFSTPGAQPRSYSNWYGDALWANYLVNGDRKFQISLLPSMEAQYQGWMNEHWDAGHQRFHWAGVSDGMEGGIGARQTKYPFGGADSYRPTLNSYVYGDLMAMSRTAALAGENAKSAICR